MLPEPYLEVTLTWICKLSLPLLEVIQPLFVSHPKLNLEVTLTLIGIYQW